MTAADVIWEETWPCAFLRPLSCPKYHFVLRGHRVVVAVAAVADVAVVILGRISCYRLFVFSICLSLEFVFQYGCHQPTPTHRAGEVGQFSLQVSVATWRNSRSFHPDTHKTWYHHIANRSRTPEFFNWQRVVDCPRRAARRHKRDLRFLHRARALRTAIM